MKKDIVIAAKAMIGGALDWEIYLSPVGAIFIAIIQYLFGPMDVLFNLMVWAFVIDYVTGRMKARHLNQLSSRIGSLGFIRKLGKAAIVAFVVQIGKVVGSDALRIAIMGGYISNEFLSIIENAEACGLVPKSMAKRLLQYQKRLSSVLNLKEGD